MSLQIPLFPCPPYGDAEATTVPVGGPGSPLDGLAGEMAAAKLYRLSTGSVGVSFPRSDALRAMGAQQRQNKASTQRLRDDADSVWFVCRAALALWAGWSPERLHRDWESKLGRGGAAVLTRYDGYSFGLRSPFPRTPALCA